MGTKTKTETESEFNVHHFEKQLTTLKDSQDAINTCCQWCLQNRVHHKKIVNSWLNVLKRVKVEQRLILFYLANDVVQYSKRKNYEYVESWGTALQKATTMVRDEKVKHKILRIFKIWEQRNVYNEEFISDLCGLLSVQPTGSRTDEPHEFQSNYVINKIKTCTKLEVDTDAKLKVLKEHNPKIIIDDALITSLKDRAHVDDVEKEVEVYVKHMEDYINALKLEIRNRINLISVLKQAENQLEADRKDVKVVVNAYKMFGTRVKTFHRKLEEHKTTLSSPAPSPDINAPSPDSETDIELPEVSATEIATPPKDNNPIYDPKAELAQQQYNAGYYNSVQPEQDSMGNSFLSNGFSSFIGSDMSFSLDSIHPSIFDATLNNTVASNSSTRSYNSPAQGATTTTLDNNNKDHQQTTILPVAPPTDVLPPPSSYSTSYESTATSASSSHHHLHQIPPLLPPPPMPMFGSASKTDADYNPTTFNCSSNTNTSSYADNNFTSSSIYGNAITNFAPPTVAPHTGGAAVVVAPFLEDATSYEPPPIGANPYPPPPTTSTTTANNDEYNPEDEVTGCWTGDLETTNNSSWLSSSVTLPPSSVLELDTPESPPMFEKEGYNDPVEYHDGANTGNGAADVDHRVIPGLGDNIDPVRSLGGKDVDHRNLISLTGSPGSSNHSNNASSSGTNWNNQTIDSDYRIRSSRQPRNSGAGNDQDYRIGFNLEQLKLPPPPPPQSEDTNNCRTSTHTIPNNNSSINTNSHHQHNTSRSPRKSDNIDSIDMDLSDEDSSPIKQNDNLKVIVDPNHQTQQHFSLEPPPPLPDLPDDVDANNFLDDLSNDLHEFSNLSDELNPNSSANHGFNESRNKDFRDSGMHSTPLRANMLPNFNTWQQQPPPMNMSAIMESPGGGGGGSMMQQPPPPSMMNTPPPPMNNMIPPPSGDAMMNHHHHHHLLQSPMMPPPQPGQGLWPDEEEYFDEEYAAGNSGGATGWCDQDEDIMQQQGQSGPPPWAAGGSPHPNNRGMFMKGGRGGGNYNRGGGGNGGSNFPPWRGGRGRNFMRGGPANNFRGGTPRGNNWMPRSRGHFRGNFRGNF